MADRYPRNMIGYGPTPPDPHWPGDAKIAVQFVVNYEEGGENSSARPPGPINAIGTWNRSMNMGRVLGSGAFAL